MPCYDFACLDCEARYEDFSFKHDETGAYPGIKCPSCGSEHKKIVPSPFAFNFANPVGTDRYNNSHDYRFFHKLPDAKAEREAELKRNPDAASVYREIDDVSCGEHFGEVK